MHHFDTKIAEKYGVNEAIFLSNLLYCLINSHTHKENFYNGIYWASYSRTYLLEAFPFWPLNKTRRIIKSCEKKGLIKIYSYHLFSFTELSNSLFSIEFYQSNNELKGF